MADPGFENSLREALEKAFVWYGRQEVFEYPADFQDQISMPLTEADIEAIRKQDDTFDFLLDESEGSDDDE